MPWQLHIVPIGDGALLGSQRNRLVVVNEHVGGWHWRPRLTGHRIRRMVIDRFNVTAIVLLLEQRLEIFPDHR